MKATLEFDLESPKESAKLILATKAVDIQDILNKVLTSCYDEFRNENNSQETRDKFDDMRCYIRELMSDKDFSFQYEVLFLDEQ